MQPHRNNNVALIRQIDHHSQRRKSEADHANEMLMQGRKSGGGACAI